MDVALIRWPAENSRRTELAGRAVPRLLLLERGAKPPTCLDPLEDWVRVPASPDEVRARAANLAARSQQSFPRGVSLDDQGVLRFGSTKTRLTPLQARLMTPLVERSGAVVGRLELAEAGWGTRERPVKPNALEANMVRLRRQIEPLGLVIRTVRSRGYVLDTTAVESRS